jgi:hypothetical protein
LESLSFALLEGHTWPPEGSEDAFIYGLRSYDIMSGPDSQAAEIDVLDPWKTCPKRYDAYLIADELADSRLPFYIPYHQRIALLKESPIHLRNINSPRVAKRFHTILTHQASKAQAGKPFVLLPYSANFLGIKRKDIVSPPALPAKNHLCSFIGNLSHAKSIKGYSIRSKVFDIARNAKQIHCFGKDINPIKYKGEALYPFAFSIAVENAREDYYFSEKLIDCILSGSIPIYWGCPSIGDIFNSRGILSFETIDEFEGIIDSLSFDLYSSLKSCAEENLRIAIESNLVDFEGYLERAMHKLHSLPAHLGSASFRLQFRKREKLTARLREFAQSFSWIDTWR